MVSNGERFINLPMPDSPWIEAGDSQAMMG